MSTSLMKFSAIRLRAAKQARSQLAQLHYRTGFSMIELLVAVLVMGIGVLGITGLQMISLQNNRGALLRSEAVVLAYDMLDRIRANPMGDLAAGVLPGSNYDGVGIGGGPPASTNCNSNNCTGNEMVNFDQRVWKCSLGVFVEDTNCTSLHSSGVLPPPTEQPGLPNGDGSIAIDVNGIITITVQWDDPNFGQREIAVQSQG